MKRTPYTAEQFATFLATARTGVNAAIQLASDMHAAGTPQRTTRALFADTRHLLLEEARARTGTSAPTRSPRHRRGDGGS